jgi:pimeloyl-ACP methyl ester carboxylesterase
VQRLAVIIITAALALASSACSGGDTDPQAGDAGDPGATTALAAYEPVYEVINCDDRRFNEHIPEEISAERVECATLSVPEDRNDTDGALVVLPVVVLRADDPNPKPDPWVYFAGGPGGGGLSSGSGMFAAGLQPSDRDVIWFDQRGTGGATPDLSCPEVLEDAYARYETTDPPDVEDRRTVDSLLECIERLREEADLDQYDTPTTALDAVDLRTALAIDQWNVVGVSYGTTVALEVLRVDPDGVRAAVIDSVYPPHVPDTPDELVAVVDRGFETLYAGCAADPACNQRYPDLERSVTDLVERLDREPQPLSYTDSEGKERTANITGQDLMDTAFQALYYEEFIALLPSFVELLAAGNYTPLELVADELLSRLDELSYGTYHLVQCADRSETLEPGALDEVLTERPLYGEIIRSRENAWHCDRIDVEPVDGAFSDLGPTDVPTLALAGEYDPITPPSYARDAAEQLGERARFVELPGIGHGALWNDCGQTIFRSFLADPSTTPDTSCVDDMGGTEWLIL